VSAVTSSDQRTKHLMRVMQIAGWEIDYIDLDLTTEHPKVDIKIHNSHGYHILARVDSIGRSTIERFHREKKLGITLRGGPLNPYLEDRFLGRYSFGKRPRTMLRSMTRYLVDNSEHQIALSDMRSAWAGIMSVRVHIDNSVVGKPIGVRDEMRALRLASRNARLDYLPQVSSDVF